MESINATSQSFNLLAIGLASIIFLIFLVIKLKVNAFISLILVSLLTALTAGIAVDDVVSTMLSGFGNTLAAVALLVGLGCMIGKILDVTGGAQVLANTLIHYFGEDKAPLALGVASLLFGFPIFFDAGLIVMMPIIMNVAIKLNDSPLKYALPCAGAFAVMHAFVPPHPGPVAAADILGANIGLLLIIGILVAIPTWYLAAYIFGTYSGAKFKVPVSSLFSGADNKMSTQLKTPKFSTVLIILITPVLLIFMDTGLNTLTVAGVIQPDNSIVSVFKMLGKTPIALLITLLLCLLIFTRDLGKNNMEKLCSESLAPVCGVILITGAGGMFGGVLRTSGIGEALADLLSETGMPVILAAFVIATCLRVAQGSATVALTTTSALIAPMVSQTTGLTEFDLCFVVIAIAAGSTVLSHFNDSGFWLVSRLLEMDEKTTLKTWTVMETLLGLTAFIIVWLLSHLF